MAYATKRLLLIAIVATG